METDRMAALGFSVLMREWRRGMAFDPWHGSLYLKLSTVITLSFFRWRGKKRTTPLDLIKYQAHWTVLGWGRTGIQIPAVDSIINERYCPALSDLMSTYCCWLITKLGKERKTQKQICENISLFAKLHNERSSQSSRSHFIRLSKPHESLTVLQERSTTVSAWLRAKDDKTQEAFPPSSAQTTEGWTLLCGC